MQLDEPMEVRKSAAQQQPSRWNGDSDKERFFDWNGENGWRSRNHNNEELLRRRQFEPVENWRYRETRERMRQSNGNDFGHRNSYNLTNGGPFVDSHPDVNRVQNDSVSFKHIESLIRPFSGSDGYTVEDWISEFHFAAILELSEVQKFVFFTAVVER